MDMVLISDVMHAFMPFIVGIILVIGALSSPFASIAWWQKTRNDVSATEELARNINRRQDQLYLLLMRNNSNAKGGGVDWQQNDDFVDYNHRDPNEGFYGQMDHMLANNSNTIKTTIIPIVVGVIIGIVFASIF